ncbi:Spo7-like protein-domain-containing protein [Cokeromyces recurvatus]|uniref:Spo7-like protein-domain-containing protein n=1 Tax=Cokeromyces recurvatus TaxID=90255 RepID=UPI00221F012A|nr:Spo7-like protein-domain-containing protein [Cokeromyces recurvatus]KAI7897927.1 Spo7-like protein-domain-containing protein [Cokeromyces recurvatus]
MNVESSPEKIPNIQRISQNNTATYRDLVIFEERLRSNMIRLLKRKRKYELLLVSLFISLFYFFYAVFIDPSKKFIIHLLNTVALLSIAGGLVFFYQSGMYSEKIVYAQKFVPHCNNSLASFNLEFNKEQSGGLSFLNKIPKKFQEGFEAYRKQYHARKKARQAKLKKSKNNSKNTTTTTTTNNTTAAL